MRARSVGLADRLRRDPPRDGREGPPRRLGHEERRAQILAEATTYFAEYGLTAQTRGLAAACGISQRLLYRFFPTKAALLQEVYRTAILGAFQSDWLPPLRDRSLPLETRLRRFYLAYFEGVLTRPWMRLFLYASLAEADMAPNYIGDVVTGLLRTIVEEAAEEAGLALPDDVPFLNEVGWTLHGAVSHLAIRRHLYRASRGVAVETVIALHVTAFLRGFPALIAAYPGRGVESSIDDLPRGD
jgi:AcrR family transcriptional regulator